MKLLKRIVFKFKNAYDGINSGLFKDTSIQIQFSFMLIALFLAWYFRITLFEWIIIIIVSTLVVGFEFVNSSIELLSDFASDKNYSIIIKEIKDLSAAAVLIVAISALVVGVLVFSKYIF